jgi:hypothetical protein
MIKITDLYKNPKKIKINFLKLKNNSDMRKSDIRLKL